MNGIDLINGSGQTIPTACSLTEPVCRSQMLTVWRRLHIEVDSMGGSQGNFTLGATTANNRIKPYQTVSIDTNSSDPNSTPLEVNRFEGGRVVFINGISFPVTGNTVDTITVQNTTGATINIVAGTQFQIFDDDDFNASDGLIKDGDTGEDIDEPDRGFMTASSDDQNINIYAPAYIHPVYDIGDNNDNTLFVPNVSDDTGQAVRALFDFDQIATEANEEFWTAYLLGGYQYITDRDDDPETEPGAGTVGVTDVQNGVGSIVFMETNGPVECTVSAAFCSIADTSAHEIGHLLNADEGDGGIMDGIGHSFSPTSLGKIRRTTHP